MYYFCSSIYVMAEREIYFYGDIDEKGTLRVHKRSDFDNALKNFGKCKVKILISKLYKKRSTSQNSYYWACIIDGYIQGFKEANGYELCDEVVNVKTGQILRIPLSREEKVQKAHRDLKTLFNEGKTTTELTTTQAEEYYEYCREYILFAFGFTVFLPNEQSEILFKQE